MMNKIKTRNWATYSYSPQTPIFALKEDISEIEVTIKDQPQKTSKKQPSALLCKVCTHKITTNENRISVNGKHKHVFFNPMGIVFELGCFSSATGCLHTGTPTLEFTWFDGYAWCITLCSSCLAHLGWHYQSSTGSEFYGLILTSLIEGPSSNK